MNFEDFNITQIRRIIAHYNLHTKIKDIAKKTKDELIDKLKEHVYIKGDTFYLKEKTFDKDISKQKPRKTKPKEKTKAKETKAKETKEEPQEKLILNNDVTYEEVSDFIEDLKNSSSTFTELQKEAYDNRKVLYNMYSKASKEDKGYIKKLIEKFLSSLSINPEF